MLGTLERFSDGADIFFGAVRNHPGHFKIFVRTDRAVLGRQIAHMSIGGQHHVIWPQIFVDCRGLCGRLDDDDIHVANILESE